MSTCTEGVLDCHSSISLEVSRCVLYASPYPSMEGNGALLGSGALIGALMAFCIGGNDSANSWASSVGSGAVPLRTALILGGVAEWLGATLLGYGVSKTIEKGVAPTDVPSCWACGYCNSHMTVYALGMLSALIGATAFLMLATFVKMPVSTTHSIVGGVAGMTIFGTAPACLNWSLKGGIGAIVASWVISPLLSGVMCVSVYHATRRLSLSSSQPLRNTLRLIPVLCMLSTLMVTLLTLLKSKPTKHLPLGMIFAIAIAVAIVVGMLAQTILRPRIASEIAAKWPALTSNAALQAAGAQLAHVTTPAGRSKVVPRTSSTEKSTERSGLRLRDGAASHSHGMADAAACAESSDSAADGGFRELSPAVTSDGIELQTGAPEAAVLSDEMEAVSEAAVKFADEPQPSVNTVRFARNVYTTERDGCVFAFKYLLVFVAFFESFAHGANDTSNATAALSAIYAAYRDGLYACSAAETPWWLMSLAGVCVGLGVYLMGTRVISTVGVGLIQIDFHKGFCIEIASAFIVIIATVSGLPVSSTHCQVGAIVCVGVASEGRRGIAWQTVGKVVASWVLTLPAAGIVAAALTALFKAAVTV